MPLCVGCGGGDRVYIRDHIQAGYVFLPSRRELGRQSRSARANVREKRKREVYRGPWYVLDTPFSLVVHKEERRNHQYSRNTFSVDFADLLGVSFPWTLSTAIF